MIIWLQRMEGNRIKGAGVTLFELKALVKFKDRILFSSPPVSRTAS